MDLIYIKANFDNPSNGPIVTRRNYRNPYKSSTKVHVRRPKNIITYQSKGRPVRQGICTCTCRCNSESERNDVSIPGINRVLSNSSDVRSRVFWSLVIVICLVTCLVQIGRRVYTFVHDPVSIAVDIVRNMTLIFPSVTVCPFYPFIYNKYINDLRKKFTEKYKIPKEKEIDVFDLLNLEGVDVSQLWKYGWLNMNSNNTVASPLRVHHSNMNAKLTLWINDTKSFLGTCTTYTLNDLIYYDGPYNGIMIIIKNLYETSGNNFIDHNDDKHDDAYWLFTVLLSETTDSPKHSLYKEVGQLVHPWRETTVCTLMKRYTRLNTATRPCEDSSVVNECKTKCIEGNIRQHISCKLPYIDSDKLEFCETPDTAKETYKKTVDFYENENTMCKCPRKCSEDVYSMSQDDVMRKVNESLIKVLMQDNTVEVIREYVTFTTDVLISEIGGILGLFMGICILTFFEVIETILIKLKNFLL